MSDGKFSHGDFVAQQVSGRIAKFMLTLAALTAIIPSQRAHGMRAIVAADGSKWRFHDSSTAASDGVLAVAPDSGTGRWLRECGAVDLKLAIGFATADTTVLLALPAGAVLALDDLYWEVTADWTGGAASAIGISSNKTAPTNWTTKGDLLGGATGDVAATLLAATGIVSGTVGTDMDTVAKRRGAIWKATDNFRFDRITSAFTAGAGFLHIRGNLLQNAGA